MAHWPDPEQKWIKVQDKHLFFINESIPATDAEGKKISPWDFPTALKAGTWVVAEVAMKL